MRRAVLIVAVALATGLPAAPAAALPRATITAAPPAETADTVADFRFEASGPALLPSFECRVDQGPWRPCASPARLDGLTGGPHSFEVRLTGALVDRRPDRHDWTVLQQTELVPEPPEPPSLPRSPGADPSPAPRRDAGGCPYGGNRAGTVEDRRLLRAVRCLINRRRARRDLRRVRSSPPLHAAAESHARDMVRAGYFAHAGRSGTSSVDRARSAGYLRGARAWTVGEVLAWGSGRLSTPTATVSAWMRSRSHRDVLLRASFRDLGVGLARGLPVRGGQPGGTFVAMLGRRS